MNDRANEKRYSAAVQTPRDYYKSEDADNFYALVRGGEDTQVGLYDHPQEDICTASVRTNAVLAGQVPGLGTDKRVMDPGSGYGGALRYLARDFGCFGIGFNVSERENERGRRQTVGFRLLSRISLP